MGALRVVLLVLHIASAAVLFAGGTGLLPSLRRAAEVGGKTFQLAAREAARRGMVLSIASIGTLVTGLLLIFNMGGFKVAPLNFHIALSLMLVAMVVSMVLLKPNTAKVLELSEKEPLDQAALKVLIKKLQVGQGIVHFLWITNLVLMLVRIYR